MSEFDAFPDPAFIMFGQSAADKKSLFGLIAGHAAELTGLDASTLARQLEARESLGSTGFGEGVAIPHGRIAGLEKPFTVLLRLAEPVDYDAADDLPVDLVFALFSPDGDGAVHLRLLARISRRMRDKEFVAKLRGARSQDALFALLTDIEAAHAA
jgi:PTS system nitrogen regulatory IIA component